MEVRIDGQLYLPARTCFGQRRDLSELVREAMAVQKITRKELAYQTGISPVYLHQLIDGQRDNPGLRIAHALLTTLHIPIERIIMPHRDI